MVSSKPLLFFLTLLNLLGQKHQVASAGTIQVDVVTVVVTESNYIEVNTQDLTGIGAGGKIGVNTDLLTEEAGRTKWIGINTQYITELVQTATIGGISATITNFPSIQIIGPVDEAGYPTDSIDIIMAPGFATQVQELVNSFCPKPGDGPGNCSPDFSPRLQSLVKSQGSVLIERGIPTPAWIAPILALVIHEFSIRFNRPTETPLHIHIDHDYLNRATFSTMASSYVVTHTVIPQQTQGPIVEQPTETEEEDEEEDSCWRYVGVDVDPIREDDIDESSDVEDPARKRSVGHFDEEVHSIPSRLAFRGLRRSKKKLVSALDPDWSLISKERIVKRRLKKSQVPKFINQIGMCEVKPAQKKIVRAEIHTPPGMVMAPFNLQNTGPEHGLDPTMWWFVPDQPWVSAVEENPCEIAKLTKKGKRDPNSPDITKNNFPLPYDQTTDERTLSVDHICKQFGLSTKDAMINSPQDETSTIPDFFNNELKTPDDPRCEAFVKMFEKPDAGLQKDRRFNSLWAQSSNPSPGNWALAGVDFRINNLKGAMLNPGIVGWRKTPVVAGPNADDNFDLLFQTWNNAGLSLQFIQRTHKYFSERNSAVYSAFRDFDEIQKCERDLNSEVEVTTWAEAYKNYISTLLSTNEKLIQDKIKEIITEIEKHPKRLIKKRSKRPNKYGRALRALKEIFPVTFFVFDHAAMLKFPETSLGIRDAVLNPRCALPEPPASNCVERIIVNCIYEYIDRPEIPDSKCPEIPVLPAECGSPPAPKKNPPPWEYCHPVADPTICTFATNYRSGEEPSDLMGQHGFVYDWTCKEIGSARDIKTNSELVSSDLTYPIKIELYETGWESRPPERLLVLRYSYANQTKGMWWDNRFDCANTRINADKPGVEHFVNRCQFDCSAK